MRRDLLILLAAVALLRLPFVAGPVQGDDVYYLLFARNALVDPLHPMQMGFRLQGETVWAAGHTRPPLNAYILAGLLKLFGEPGETEFHLFYSLFSLIAVWAFYFLARRFCRRPLAASFLFLAAPAFIVNGQKLEADLPLLAFWTAGFAFFVHRRFRWAMAAMALAGMCAYQSVFAVPALAHLAWHRFRREPGAWAAALAAPAAIGLWQIFERATTGAAPAAVLAGYFETYGLLALERKVVSAAALAAHLGMLISPVAAWFAFTRTSGERRRTAWFLILGGIGAASFTEYTFVEKLFLGLCFATALCVLAAAIEALFRDRQGDEGFLAAWALVYFGAAAAVFYAGSARYLLPMAAPAALLVARRVRTQTVLWAAAALHLALGLALATAENEYVEQYREIAREIGERAGEARLWTNAEWGLRYYLERGGAEALLANQSVPAGAVVVTSELAARIPYVAEGVRQELLRREIRTSAVPLRLIGKGSRSGYSSSEFGVLPFGLGGGPIDLVVARRIGCPEPTLSYLRLGEKEADSHLLSGFYPSDGAEWRWMSRRGAAVVRVPENAAEFELKFHIPESSPARRVRVMIDGEPVADERYEATGGHALHAPYDGEAGKAARVVIEAEPSYTPAGDARELSIVVIAFGFRPSD